MTADRPYRRAPGVAAARAELRRHAGTQFDAAVVEALLRATGADGRPDRGGQRRARRRLTGGRRRRTVVPCEPRGLARDRTVRDHH